jgi:hypothetical protein
MPYYAQVSASNKVVQMFYQPDSSGIPHLQEQYPDDQFIETDQFGDADCFAYVGGKIVSIPRPVNAISVIYQNKQKRNQLLTNSDWTQLPDVPIDTSVKAAWTVYRQALRDMTEQDFIDSVFPSRPIPVIDTGLIGATNPD